MGRNAPYVALKSFLLCIYELLLLLSLLLLLLLSLLLLFIFAHIHHSFYFIVSPISFIVKVPDT